MSVEVRIPKEITEYKEKIMFGLSIRQLICLFIAIIISIPSYIFLKNILGEELTGYIVMVEVIPFIAIGFLKPKGLNFEKVLIMFLKHNLGKSERDYKTIVQTDILEGGNINDIQKKSKKKSIRRKTEEEREYKGFEPSKKDRKRKFKEVKRQIKGEKRDFRQRKKDRQKVS